MMSLKQILRNAAKDLETAPVDTHEVNIGLGDLIPKKDPLEYYARQMVQNAMGNDPSLLMKYSPELYARLRSEQIANARKDAFIKSKESDADISKKLATSWAFLNPKAITKIEQGKFTEKASKENAEFATGRKLPKKTDEGILADARRKKNSDFGDLS